MIEDRSTTPNLELLDMEGRPFALQQARGCPLVLIFLRWLG